VSDPRIAPVGPDLPALDGVEHRYITTASGVTIHVADAGPSDGTPVMLVHGFPQHWWEWHRLIGPLAADGYRVLAPDLRGAGWSDAPRGPYRKAEMADDLADVIDRLGVGPVKLVAHDWGGPVAFILLIQRPDLVTAFCGLNTIAPWMRLDGPAIRHFWSFWYQFVLLTPGLGPWLIAGGQPRFIQWLVRWVGGGFDWTEQDIECYQAPMRDPARAYAGSQWYRTFQTRELVGWLRGKYAMPVNVPLRFVTGLNDPVITPTLHRGYESWASDVTFETIPGVGHWIVEEAHDLVLDRLRTFLAE
jgi:pimeloyl-ACP methyl ester carboxylesterase